MNWIVFQNQIGEAFVFNAEKVISVSKVSLKDAERESFRIATHDGDETEAYGPVQTFKEFPVWLL